jgi:hypothetical protein
MGHHRQRRKISPHSIAIARKPELEEQDAQRWQPGIGRDPLPPQNVLYLQRTVGNQAVQRLIQRKPAQSSVAGAGPLGRAMAGMQQLFDTPAATEQQVLNQDSALEQEAEDVGSAVMQDGAVSVDGVAERDSIQARLMPLQQVKDGKSAASKTKGGFLKIKRSTSDLEKLHNDYTGAVAGTDWDTAFTKLNAFSPKIERMRGKTYWISDLERDNFLDMLETSVAAEEIWLEDHVSQNALDWWVYHNYKLDISFNEAQTFVANASGPEQGRMQTLLDARRGEQPIAEFTHFLEAIDTQHRYGMNNFFQQWVGAPGGQSFFVAVNALEQANSFGMPDRMNKRVTYYTALQRAPFALTITGGGVQTAAGANFPNNGIYVLGRNDVFYGDTDRSAIHHTSFMNGEPIKGAGHMHMTGGALDKIDVNSGHYFPSPTQMLNTVLQLRAQGMNITNLDVVANVGQPAVKAPMFLQSMGVV